MRRSPSIVVCPAQRPDLLAQAKKPNIVVIWGDDFPEKFFDQLPKVLADATPLPGEEALNAQILAVIAAAQKDQP